MLFDMGHTIRLAENIMDILHLTNKGNHMNTVKKHYIHNETQNATQLNDKSTVKNKYLIQQ